ncbi:hypothetical protein KPL71_010478 [Citrus sinensis]|uniref:Uncharacterized protein n=1 Tax=Citrus sinensis TaxID=2711 RepID=A0ACB8MNV8_CITSI|nr:hypothetical protein KPL71_010478 [Citrus sinensis]
MYVHESDEYAALFKRGNTKLICPYIESFEFFSPAQQLKALSDGFISFLAGPALKMDTMGRTTAANYECLLFGYSYVRLVTPRQIESLSIKFQAVGYEFDNDEFHAFVHGKLPYEKLKPDPVLRNLLLSMPQRKIIFTNADQKHAMEVLGRLGLEDCFEGIICFETINPRLQPADNTDGIENNSFSSNQRILCKPSLEAIETAIRIANVDPKKTIFFDDSARNIASAKAAGLHTVIVGSSVPVPPADHALNSIHNIKEAIPEIWEGEGEQLEQVIQPAAVETAVLA